MNWSKAKNIIIIILVAMNIGLLFASQYTKGQNSLSFEAERSIVKLLNQNGIELYAELPKEFTPMSQLRLANQQMNIDELKADFFDNEEDVKISVELGDTILKKDNKTLTIKQSKIVYDNKDNYSGIDGLDKMMAKKISDQFVKNKLGSSYANYKYFSTHSNSNSYCITYYESYKNYKIISNYIKVNVTNKGITAVELFRYPPENFVGATRQICSSDEALLTFMEEVYPLTDQMNLFVDKMELGYIIETNSHNATNIVAIPCYIISVEGSDKVYYINAYTNTLMEDL